MKKPTLYLIGVIFLFGILNPLFASASATKNNSLNTIVERGVWIRYLGDKGQYLSEILRARNYNRLNNEMQIKFDHYLDRNTVEHIDLRLLLSKAKVLETNNKFISYIIPYTLSYGGSGTFVHLGIFKMGTNQGFIIQQDSIFLGDRIAIKNIEINNQTNILVSYLGYGLTQSFAEKPNKHIVKNIYTTRAYKALSDTPLKQPISYSLPNPINLNNLLKNKFKNLQASESYQKLTNMAFNMPDFYLFGMDKNTRYISYLLDFGLDDGDFYTATFKVIDLINNKIVALKNIHFKNTGLKPKNGYDFDKFIETNYSYIQKSLDKFKIIRNPSLKLYTNPIEYKNDILTYDSSIKSTPFVLGGNVAKSYQILLHSKIYGDKTVYEKSFKPSYYSNIYGVKPIGYFKMLGNPSRVVLLVATITRGFEGTPHDANFYFIGIDLINSKNNNH